MQSAAARPASDAEMLHEMVQGAYALGKAATELALSAKDDLKAFCDLSAEFRHCFFAVRMGIRLGLNLRAAPGRAAPLPRPETEYERTEVEHDDSRDPVERPDYERDRERDREYEPVSLPRFLKSLGVAVDAAERRKADLPPAVANETLPRLRTLLASAEATSADRRTPPKASLAVLTRPPPAAPARARTHLLGSAAPPRGPPPKARPPWRSG